MAVGDGCEETKVANVRVTNAAKSGGKLELDTYIEANNFLGGFQEILRGRVNMMQAFSSVIIVFIGLGTYVK